MLQSNVSLNYLLKLKFEHFKAHFIYEQVLRIIENSSFKDSPVDHFHIYCLLKFALYALYNLERMAKQVEKNVFMN